jgi:hypothetical protein
MNVEINKNITDGEAEIILTPENKTEKNVLSELYYYSVFFIRLEENKNNKFTIKMKKE